MPTESTSDEPVKVEDAAATAAPEATDVKDPVAETSDAAKEGEKSSMLDAVKTALKPEEEAAPASKEPDQKAEAEKTDGDKPEDENAEVDADELTPEEEAALNKRTRNRIQKLVAQRNEANTELEAVKPKAKALDEISDYMRVSKLSTDDVDNTFKLAALVRNDPAAALPHLEALVNEVKQRTGSVLPSDLQEQVRMGYITEPAALELSKSRAQSANVTRELEETRHAQAEQQSTQQRQDAVNASVQAADNWHKSQAAKDPDFALKQDRIAELAELEMRRTGKIPTPAETQAMMDNIKTRVDGEVRKFRPALQPNNPVDGGASQTSTPEPKSMVEAMRQAVGS